MTDLSPIEGMAPGEYGGNAPSQKIACDTLYRQYIRAAVDQILKDGDKKNIRIGDYGASDCFNSTSIYKKTMEQVSNKCNVVFSAVDLPTNDWQTARKWCSTVGLPIIDTMDGDKDDSSESRIEFVPASFFGQCLAAESVDIAFTSMATEWLSDVRGISLNGSVAHVAHEERTSKEDRDKIRARGMEDGVNFLLSRAKELKEGGWLFMGEPIRLEKDGWSIVTTLGGMYETMNDVALNWVKQGKMTQDQANEMFLPQYDKNIDDWKECFEDPRVKSTGLTMEDSMVVLLENPFYSQVYSHSYVKTEGEEKAAMKFASEYAKSGLAFSKNKLMKAVKTEECLKEYVDDMVELMAKDPAKFKYDFLVQYIVARMQRSKMFPNGHASAVEKIRQI